jgi:DNA-binding NtrC family response regulator
MEGFFAKDINERDPGSAMRILVVDDDTGTLNALKASLASAGHEAVVAEDANQALSAIRGSTDRAESIALLVTDLKMPGMDGLELIRAAQKERPGLPSILMTAHGDRSVRREVAGLGSCRYLGKPFSPERLMTEIEALSP